VECAPDGVAGLELARAIKPDVILLDWRMPGFGGEEVLTILKSDRSTLRDVPVLIFSADNSSEMHARAMELGAAGWLIKARESGEQIVAAVAEYAQP
jgi:CheY-like chemotaxis protein